MTQWDDGADDIEIGYRVIYKCLVCEEYFQLSPIAPLRCPYCFADPRYIIGPLIGKVIDEEKLERKHRDKYGPSMRK